MGHAVLLIIKIIKKHTNTHTYTQQQQQRKIIQLLPSLTICVLPKGGRSVGKWLLECQGNTMAGTKVIRCVVFLLNVAPGRVFCVLLTGQ